MVGRPAVAKQDGVKIELKVVEGNNDIEDRNGATDGKNLTKAAPAGEGDADAEAAERQALIKGEATTKA